MVAHIYIIPAFGRRWQEDEKQQVQGHPGPLAHITKKKETETEHIPHAKKMVKNLES